MRIRLTVASIAAACLMSVVGVVGAANASSEPARSGTLHIVKNCDGFASTPPTCAITSSDVGFLPVGSIITYLQPAALVTPAGSDVVITRPHGHSTIHGNCALSLATGTGLCVLRGGTGVFRRFHATIVVTYLPVGDGNNWGWVGTYSFGHHGDDD
jgi:hypothetical protein